MFPFVPKPIKINRHRLTSLIDVLKMETVNIGTGAPCDFNDIGSVTEYLAQCGKTIDQANDIPGYKMYNSYYAWFNKCNKLLKMLSPEDTISPTYKQAKNHSYFTSNPNIQGFHPYLLFALIDPTEEIYSFDYAALYPAVAARLFNDSLFQKAYLNKTPYTLSAWSPLLNTPEKKVNSELSRKDVKAVLLAFMFGASRNTIVKKFHLDVETADNIIEKLKVAYPVITRLSKKNQDKVRFTAPVIFNKKCADLSKQIDIVLIRHDQFIFRAKERPDPEIFNIYDTQKEFYLYGKLQSAKEIIEQDELKFFHQ